MDLLTYILLGLIQGFLEWIPVSSEAFLFLFLVVLGEEPLSALLLSIAIHLSSALAAITYYFKDYHSMARSVLRRHRNSSKRMLSFILVATLFSAISAVPLFLLLCKFFGEMRVSALIALGMVGCAMIATGGFMRSFKRPPALRGYDEINVLDSIIFGLIQGLSVIPGVSRSGVTITAMLARKFDKEVAVKVSFLCAPPIIICAVSFEALMASAGTLFATEIDMGGLVTACMTAYVASLIGIKFITKLAERLDFSLFLICMGLFLLLNVLLLI
ncbi:MAG: undecaprenyl-diphosphate phosphatase [Candidatus Baldrarchaeia archaeon]